MYSIIGVEKLCFLPVPGEYVLEPVSSVISLVVMSAHSLRCEGFGQATAVLELLTPVLSAALFLLLSGMLYGGSTLSSSS